MRAPCMHHTEVDSTSHQRNKATFWQIPLWLPNCRFVAPEFEMWANAIRIDRKSGTVFLPCPEFSILATVLQV
jgi:hypothetical protein